MSGIGPCTFAGVCAGACPCVAAAKRMHHNNPGQILIPDGGLPSWGIPISRLDQGLYFVRLRLLRKRGGGGSEESAAGKGAAETAGDAETVAEGGGVLRIMPGGGGCLRQSVTNDYCSHAAVDPILQVASTLALKHSVSDFVMLTPCWRWRSMGVCCVALFLCVSPCLQACVSVLPPPPSPPPALPPPCFSFALAFAVNLFSLSLARERKREEREREKRGGRGGSSERI